MKRTLGIIGLGRMGRHLSEAFRRKGLEPIVTTRDATVLAAMRDSGFAVAPTPRDLTRRVDVIVLAVFDTAAVANVLEASDGVLDALIPGTLVIDMGTTSIDATRRFASLVGERRGLFVDAPIAEAPPRDGPIAILAGGTEEAIARARPLLEAVGRVTHMGKTGAGQATKAARELLLGATLVGITEALALAARAGVDGARARDALLGGRAEARALRDDGLRIGEARFDNGIPIARLGKHLREIADYADATELDLPGLRATALVYRRALERGLPGLDQSAVVKLYQ